MILHWARAAKVARARRFPYEGQVFAPYVSNGPIGYKVKNFPIDFLTNGTLERRF